MDLWRAHKSPVGDPGKHERSVAHTALTDET
jgi:hypothetical protein